MDKEIASRLSSLSFKGFFCRFYPSSNIAKYRRFIIFLKVVVVWTGKIQNWKWNEHLNSKLGGCPIRFVSSYKTFWRNSWTNIVLKDYRSALIPSWATDIIFERILPPFGQIHFHLQHKIFGPSMQKRAKKGRIR